MKLQKKLEESPVPENFSKGRLLMVLLDAFNYSYLKYTNFLKELEHRPLKPLPGYGGVAESVFTGVSSSTPYTIGVFRYNPSRFWVFRLFRTYNSLSPTVFRILLKHGKNFDVVSKHPYSQPNAFDTYSIFDLCKNDKIPFLYYNHPWWCTNDKCKLIFNKYSDEYALLKILPYLNNYKFVFLHLYQLDRVGHKYGPTGETFNYVAKLDTLVEKLYRKWNGDILLWSDHGMDKVYNTVDLRNIVKNEIHFLDSTMARLWNPSDKTVESLKKLKNGRFLDSEEMKRYALNESGTHIWSADKGTVILPNFWTKKPVKGMHGYRDGSDATLIANFHLDKSKYETIFSISKERLGIY